MEQRLFLMQMTRTLLLPVVSLTALLLLRNVRSKHLATRSLIRGLQRDVRIATVPAGLVFNHSVVRPARWTTAESILLTLVPIFALVSITSSTPATNLKTQLI